MDALPAGTAARSDRREIPGFCTLCRSRCGALNIVEHGRLIEVKPLAGHPTGKALCAKGRAAPEIVHGARRLTTPLRRTRPKTEDDPGWQPVTWDEALDQIADRLRGIAAESGPEAVAFSFTSPSASSISDSLPWLEKFMWTFGSPNLCWGTELCNWHKDHAHEFTLGTGLPVPDYRNSELIVLWGHNPANAWLAQAEAIGEGRRGGARLVVIDPRRTSLAREADLWLRIRPGTDGVLALAVTRMLIETGGYDDTFVRRWTNAPFLVRGDNQRLLRAADIGIGSAQEYVVWDPQALAPRVCATPAAGLAGVPPSLEGRFALRIQGADVVCRPAWALLREHLDGHGVDQAAAITGVPAPQIRALAEAIGSVRRVCYYGWTGIGQHGNATQTDRAIASLFALTGQYDAPGGNVWWTGPAVEPVSSYATLAPAQRAKALGLAERPLGPAGQGWITGADLYRAILERRPYRVRALLGFGSNLLVSQPDPERGLKALQQLEFQVHCDLFMSPTAALADFVLPVNSAWEREGLRVGFEIGEAAQQHVQLRAQAVPAQGDGRSDVWIAVQLARRLGFGEALFDGDFDAAWNHLLAPLGLTVSELRKQPAGVRVALQHRYHKYEARGFATETGRIELYSERLLRHGHAALPSPRLPPQPSADFPVVLTTAKNGYFCHSQHRGIGALRKRSPWPRIDIATALATSRGIDEGDLVDIRSEQGRICMKAHLDPELEAGTAVAEYGWWQAAPDLGLPGYAPAGPGSANYNALLSEAGADAISGAPNVRSLVCDVRRAAAPRGWEGFRALVVRHHRMECDGVATIELAAPDGTPLPPFAPGQFITLALDEAAAHAGQVRSYSLTGAAMAQPASYTLAVKGDGAVSRHLVDRCQVGHTILAKPPAGAFLLPRANEFPVVLMAAGIGITPFMAYLETLALQVVRPEVWLYFGARERRRQPFADRIAALRAAMPELQVRTFFSRPQPHDRVGIDYHHAGRIVSAHVDRSLLRRRARFYLCGPQGMVDAAIEGLSQAGVPHFEIFQERFVSPRLRSVPTASGPHRVTFRRSGVELQWSAGSGSLLDLAQRHGIDIPTGCRVGQCESCLVQIVQGQVDHAATGAELPSASCLSCQAVPRSDVVLDA